MMFPVRGTACGTASALSRMYVLDSIYSCVIYNGGFRGGMIAPVLGGVLLMVARSLPVYFSIVIFTLAGVCTLMLRVEEKGRHVEGLLAH